MNVISALHSTLNTIVMIWTKKPYRDFIFNLPIVLLIKKKMNLSSEPDKRVSVRQVSVQMKMAPKFIDRSKVAPAGNMLGDQK